ncbi:hypothetical protein [Streptomyces sp. NPDC058252]|uniref:hypothetical protein n=1 Tax=Streptomyces sp. NPDC058252 TaxID=3346405 RepID=UPI0036EEB89E
MQPEQLVLPFEDEVLVILYKREVPPVRTAERWSSLEWTVRSRAKSLGFQIKHTRRDRWWDDGALHISLRAEAERT